MLAWEPARIIMAHGELIEGETSTILRSAWKVPLGGGREAAVGQIAAAVCRRAAAR